MSKKNNNKDSPENISSEIAKENEKIEELINNPLLLKEYEDLEEEEDLESNYTEKENPEEIQQYNLIKNKKSPKIHKDIIGNLLIELFEYHYNEISREKKLDLSHKILESKCTVEFFCTKLNKNFSKYILVILEQKIEELIKYTKKIVISKIESIKNILEVKSSLQLTGRDIIKIFEKPFQKTKNFDISSVLIIKFILNLFSVEKFKINDEEYGQIIEMDRYEEKDRFEKYIEECKSYFEKIQNGELEEDSDVEVYYEEENQIGNDQTDALTKETNDSSNNITESEESEISNIIKKDSINIDEEITNDENEEKRKNSEEKKDIFIIGDIINKNNNPKKSSHNQEHKENKNKKVNSNSNKNKKNCNNIENKVEHYLNIEDLVAYINGNNNKKKRKKKHKKKAKVSKATIVEGDKDNINDEKDEVYEKFKTDLTNYTINLKKIKKIKPKISDAFLEKLNSIN